MSLLESRKVAQGAAQGLRKVLRKVCFFAVFGRLGARYPALVSTIERIHLLLLLLLLFCYCGSLVARKVLRKALRKDCPLTTPCPRKVFQLLDPLPKIHRARFKESGS